MFTTTVNVPYPAWAKTQNQTLTYNPIPNRKYMTLRYINCGQYSVSKHTASHAYSSKGKGKKVKEADLYSAFIEVPFTQGAQVRITQCYLQTTPYLPLPRKHSPDGASQTEVADI